MRTFHSVLAAATLLGGSLVVGVTGTASAVPPEYVGTVDTDTDGNALNNPQEDGAPARIRLRVDAEDDAGNPRGAFVVRYVRSSNDDVVRKFRRDYDGSGYETYSFANVPQGRYDVKVTYDPPANSVFKESRTSFGQRIR